MHFNLVVKGGSVVTVDIEGDFVDHLTVGRLRSLVYDVNRCIQSDDDGEVLLLDVSGDTLAVLSALIRCHGYVFDSRRVMPLIARSTAAFAWRKEIRSFLVDSPPMSQADFSAKLREIVLSWHAPFAKGPLNPQQFHQLIVSCFASDNGIKPSRFALYTALVFTDETSQNPTPTPPPPPPPPHVASISDRIESAVPDEPINTSDQPEADVGAGVTVDSGGASQ
jgi:hypothetical protein